MAHRHESALVAHYGSAQDASVDYDAVAAAHEGGTIGHLEAAVVSRDSSGMLTIERHERLGGVHLSHGPTDELRRVTEEVPQASFALVVVAQTDDLPAVDAAVTHAQSRSSHVVEHFGLAESGIAGGGVPDPAVGDSGTGFTDGQVGQLGV